jgi:hypothetical protein
MHKNRLFFVIVMRYVMVISGSAVGVALGGWAGVSMLVVIHRGVRALADIHREAWVFPEIPTWLHDKEPTLANITGSVFAILGLTAGLVFARDNWRRLARRFGWTKEEIEAFEKRDPGW